MQNEVLSVDCGALVVFSWVSWRVLDLHADASAHRLVWLVLIPQGDFVRFTGTLVAERRFTNGFYRKGVLVGVLAAPKQAKRLVLHYVDCIDRDGT